MKKFVPLNKDEPPIVNRITPDNIIGFIFGSNVKGFVRTLNYAGNVTEDTIVVLSTAYAVERSDEWLISGEHQSWEKSIEFLLKNNANIFVFDNSKELLKWLSE